MYQGSGMNPKTFGGRRSNVTPARRGSVHNLRALSHPSLAPTARLISHTLLMGARALCDAVMVCSSFLYGYDGQKKKSVLFLIIIIVFEDGFRFRCSGGVLRLPSTTIPVVFFVCLFQGRARCWTHSYGNEDAPYVWRGSSHSRVVALLLCFSCLESPKGQNENTFLSYRHTYRVVLQTRFVDKPLEF